jgi:hypothetical protein
MKASWLFLMVAPMVAGSTNPMLDDLARRWQGAWVVRDADYPGSVQAWAVQGGSVEVYDPASGQSRREQFTLESPCRIVRKQSNGSGGAETVSTNTFVFGSDGLYVAPAQVAGGLRRGNLLTACIGDHVYTFDTRSQQCQKWDAAMSGNPMPAEECEVGGSPPAFVLRRYAFGQDVRLNVSGEALLSPGLAAQVSEPQRTFQAAIRLATALSKPR